MMLSARQRLLAFALVLLMLVAPVMARPESEADVAARMRQLLALIHEHALTQVPDSQLVGGAFESLHQVLLTAPPAEEPPAGLETRLRDLVAGQPVEWERVERVAVEGMLKRLDDRWAAYLSPEVYRGLRDRSYAAAYSGIGVTLFREVEHGPVVLCQPSEETPAARAGLQGGDELLTLNGQSVASLTENEIRARLQAEPGTKLELGLRRDGQPVGVTVECASIHADLVHSKLVLKNGQRVAYVQVGTFAASTPASVAEALAKLDADACVLDLRNNGGGQVSAAVRLASLFMPPGTEVTSVHRRSGVDVLRAVDTGVHFDGPVVVLINENSASAAELTAGALHDNDHALLVGSKSFGKGAVQRILPLPDGSALKITTAHYRTPSGQSIEGRGLVPDVSAQTALRWVGTGGDQDEQLRVALGCATRSLAANR